MAFTAYQVAEKLGGELIGDGSIALTGFSTAENARAGDLIFAEKDTYYAAAEASAASAVLVSGPFASATKTVIRVANARASYARLLPLFFPPDEAQSGIHPTAMIAATAQIDPTAEIGPGCVIGAGVKIGARTVLMGGNHIGRDSRIGDDVRLFPNVVLYNATQVGNRVAIHAGTVIGSDGYGYFFDQGRHNMVLKAAAVKIGMPVKLYWEKLSDDINYPAFQPA